MNREAVADIRFVDPGPLRDEELMLELRSTSAADHLNGYVPAYHFRMTRAGTDIELWQP